MKAFFALTSIEESKQSGPSTDSTNREKKKLAWTIGCGGKEKNSVEEQRDQREEKRSTNKPKGKDR